MSNLLELAERCERAEGPDRELDEAIEQALPPSDPRTELPSLWNERAARFYGAQIGSNDSEADYQPTRYTASIDAALTLVPEGWGVRITRFIEGVAGQATVTKDSGMGWQTQAATPALALCAAALRALAEPRP